MDRRLTPRVTGNDPAILKPGNDRRTKAKVTNGFRDCRDSGIVNPWILAPRNKEPWVKPHGGWLIVHLETIAQLGRRAQPATRSPRVMRPAG